MSDTAPRTLVPTTIEPSTELVELIELNQRLSGEWAELEQALIERYTPAAVR